VADAFADARPRQALRVQERDAPVAEVVRRERRDSRRDAGARERRSEPVGTEAAEDRPVGDAVVARNERRDRVEDGGGRTDPACRSRLRRSRADAPAAPTLVDVAPRQRLGFARMPVASRTSSRSR
jgi:hypothetical protein